MTLLTLLTFMFLVPSYCFAANSTYSYWLLSADSNRYELTVSVTSALYDYYQNKDHQVNSIDFGRFITPYVLKPIADSLWRIYTDDEDFANGVLMITHQIPYEESIPQKYPVEVIAENKGDCDLFSFIVASVMIAGGLDVVLLFYEEQSHVNVGVCLSHEPKDARSAISYFDYYDKRYYIAETTGGNSENGWRIGECPDELIGVSANVITLESVEQFSPGQVSAGYRLLSTSSITLSLSSNIVIEEYAVGIVGHIAPPHPNQNATLYVKRAGDSEWTLLRIMLTDSSGHYSYMWRPNSASMYQVSASWSGDTDHSGANSDTQTLTIIPMSWIIVGTVSILLILMVTIAALAFKNRTMT